MYSLCGRSLNILFWREICPIGRDSLLEYWIHYFQLPPPGKFQLTRRHRTSSEATSNSTRLTCLQYMLQCHRNILCWRGWVSSRCWSILGNYLVLECIRNKGIPHSFCVENLLEEYEYLFNSYRNSLVCSPAHRTALKIRVSSQSLSFWYCFCPDFCIH